MSNEKQSQQQDQNEKKAKIQDLGLHTKQEGDSNDGGGAGNPSTGGSSDGTGTV